MACEMVLLGDLAELQLTRALLAGQGLDRVSFLNPYL